MPAGRGWTQPGGCRCCAVNDDASPRQRGCQALRPAACHAQSRNLSAPLLRTASCPRLQVEEGDYAALLALDELNGPRRPALTPSQIASLPTHTCRGAPPRPAGRAGGEPGGRDRVSNGGGGGDREGGGGAAGRGDAFNPCSVCLEEPREGDVLRSLPCMHFFHKACIDPWLASSSCCPVCKHDILASS